MNLKPACFLLSLCYAGSAASIGLGDISVRSHLGQPLHATVALIGATPATLADCFSLDSGAGSIAPPLHAQFSIEQVGGQTLLHIRTPKSINDPIVQFVVAADCEARLQREYVVLLDPPALLETAVVSDTPATAEPAKTLEKAPSAVAVPRPAPRPARRATRVKPSSQALPNARSVTAPPQTAASPRQTVTATPKPRLVISGKDGAQPDASLPLQPAALPERPLPLASDPAVTELSDDNTALSRRIAHLEMQLDRLKKRNAELDAMRATAATQIAPPAPESPQWPLYLLAIGLLAGVGALGTWLGRRRNRPSPGISDDMSWVQQSDNLPALPETAQTFQSDAEPMPERMPAITPPALVDTEVSDGILDQAEVYMAHGHGELAIHLLQEHLREAPRESPVPWLLLLDLLLRAGDHAGYEVASTECSRYFNVNLITQDTEAGNGLEAYPHLFDQLTQKWNSPEIYDFFDDLIYDHRGGTRQGFEPAAYREILLLRSIAQDVLPLAA